MSLLPKRPPSVSAGQTPGRRVPVLPAPQAPPSEQRRVTYVAAPTRKEQPVAVDPAVPAKSSLKQVFWIVAALLPVVLVFALAFFVFDVSILVSMILSALIATGIMYVLVRRVTKKDSPEAAAESEAQFAPKTTTEVSKPVKVKTKAPPRVPKFKPDVPEPQYGVSGFVWQLVGRWLYSWKGWNWVVWRTKNDRLHYLDQQFYANRKVQKSAAVFNKKGGAGKTPETTWFSALLGRIFKGAAIVGVDVNTGGGHLVDLFNIKRSATLTIRQYLARFRDLTTPEIIQGFLERHWKTGTWLIASDTSATNRIDLTWFIDGLKHLKTLFFWVFADTGNDPYNNATLATLYCVDTAVLAGNTANKYTLSDITDTMDTFKRLGFEDKMKHSVIVILGAPARKRRKFAADFNHPLAQVYCIPKSRVMMTGTDADVAAGKFKEMDIDALPKRILVPLLEALLAIVVAEPVKTAMSVEDLEKKVEVEVEVMSNGQPATKELDDVDHEPATGGPNLKKETTQVDTPPAKTAPKTRAPRRQRSTTAAVKTQPSPAVTNGYAPVFTSTSGNTLLDTRSQEADNDSEGSQP